jgi:hypothetical protein
MSRRQYQELSNQNYTLNVVRKKQKLVLVIANTHD